MSERRVLVTGANGFVGQPLCSLLEKKGWRVLRATRRGQNGTLSVGDIDGQTDWAEALKEVKAVVHLAARVHVMNETARDPLEKFRTVNTLGTAHLAKCAADAGVERFVYVSSIKVNGEETTRIPFDETMAAAPQDPYGQSKWEAEQALWAVSKETGLEGVVIRPPLVYGPGVKGNFASLMAVAQKGVPLPLGSIQNTRSLIYVGNLADSICATLENPAAAGETFLVSDGQDLSTAHLIEKVAWAMDKKARLFPFPLFLLTLAGKLTGKTAMVHRLTSSLQVNSAKIRNLVGWQPPFSVEKGLKLSADWFITNKTDM